MDEENQYAPMTDFVQIQPKWSQLLQAMVLNLIKVNMKEENE